MVFRSLIQKIDDPIASFSDTAAEILKFTFEFLVFGALYGIDYCRLNPSQGGRHGVGHYFWMSNPEFASFAEIRCSLDSLEKSVNRIASFSGFPHRFLFTQNCEQALFRFR